uniref:trichohyalin-like n=1 Tax=Semicossyphus pulcher TaxID=241346 RepID=UPI0037E78E55
MDKTEEHNIFDLVQEFDRTKEENNMDRVQEVANEKEDSLKEEVEEENCNRDYSGEIFEDSEPEDEGSLEDALDNEQSSESEQEESPLKQGQIEKEAPAKTMCTSEESSDAEEVEEVDSLQDWDYRRQLLEDSKQEGEGYLKDAIFFRQKSPSEESFEAQEVEKENSHNSLCAGVFMTEPEPEPQKSEHEEQNPLKNLDYCHREILEDSKPEDEGSLEDAYSFRQKSPSEECSEAEEVEEENSLKNWDYSREIFEDSEPEDQGYLEDADFFRQKSPAEESSEAEEQNSLKNLDYCHREILEDSKPEDEGSLEDAYSFRQKSPSEENSEAEEVEEVDSLQNWDYRRQLLEDSKQEEEGYLKDAFYFRQKSPAEESSEAEEEHEEQNSLKNWDYRYREILEDSNAEDEDSLKDVLDIEQSSESEQEESPLKQGQIEKEIPAKTMCTNSAFFRQKSPSEESSEAEEEHEEQNSLKNLDYCHREILEDSKPEDEGSLEDAYSFRQKSPSEENSEAQEVEEENSLKNWDCSREIFEDSEPEDQGYLEDADFFRQKSPSEESSEAEEQNSLKNLDYCHREILEDSEPEDEGSLQDDYSFRQKSPSEESSEAEEQNSLKNLDYCHREILEDSKPEGEGSLEDDYSFRQKSPSEESSEAEEVEEVDSHNSLCAEVFVTELEPEPQKSKKVLTKSNTKPKKTLSALRTKVEEKDVMIERLKTAKKGFYNPEEDTSEDDDMDYSDIRAQTPQITKQQEEVQKKDKEIESLRFNSQALIAEIDDQEEANQWASDLNEEQAKNCSLQREHEAAVSQWQQGAEKLERLSQENQELVSLNKRLQDDFLTVVYKDKFAQKQFQEEREGWSTNEDRLKAQVAELKKSNAELVSKLEEEQTKNCSLQRDYEAVVSQQHDSEELNRLTQKNQDLESEITRLQGKLEASTNTQLKEKQLGIKEGCSRIEEGNGKEKAQLSRASKKIKILEKEISEKTLACEKRVIKEKALRSELKKEKERFEKMFLQQQAGVDPLAILRDQLRDANASSEGLMYDMQTLRMENVDITSKFESFEREHEQLKSKYRCLSERYEKKSSVSQLQQDPEKLQQLSQENQKLASLNKKLKGELRAAVNESRFVKQQLQDERDSCSRKEDLLKAQVADLMKSQNELKQSSAELESKLSETNTELKDIEIRIELFNGNLKAFQSQQAESAKRGRLYYAEIKALKGHHMKQQEKTPETYNKIKSLRCNIQTLQTEMEGNNKIFSSLQEEVKQWASDLKEEQTKNCLLQRDYETAVFQQDAEKLNRLTQENQDLASEIKRLQSKLEAATNKQLEENDCTGNEEIQKERARFSRASKKIKMQEKELSEKTLAYKKRVIKEKALRSELRKEKERFEKMFLQQQAGVDPLAILRDQLRDANASSESLMYDMQNLRMENVDITSHFESFEREHEQLKSKYSCLLDRSEKMISKKNQHISENGITIAKLERMVDELRAQLQKSKARQTGLEDALKKEQRRNCGLQQRADSTASAVDKASTTCDKRLVVLQEALNRQAEERQKLAVALQKADENVNSLQKELLVESNIRLQQVRDAELRLKQQTADLDQSRKDLHQLRDEHINLACSYAGTLSKHQERMKDHSDLKLKCERLSYTKQHLSPWRNVPPILKYQGATYWAEIAPTARVNFCYGRSSH